MENLHLTIGLSQSPYTQALFDGSVCAQGIELRLQTRFGDGLDNVGARHRAIIGGKIDGGEVSISSYILARLRGVPLIALPVFLSRRFRLRCMYCREGSSLKHPSELAGKKITVHRYNATHAGLAQRHFAKPVRRAAQRYRLVRRGTGHRRRKPAAAAGRCAGEFYCNTQNPRARRRLVENGEIDAALEPYATSLQPEHALSDGRLSERGA